jgi:plasmid stabilization system protein ParE
MRDLYAIRDHIAADSPRAAEAIADKLLVLADSLAEMPNRGRTVAGASRSRELVLGRYLLRYVVAREKVLIVRVRRSAQG